MICYCLPTLAVPARYVSLIFCHYDDHTEEFQALAAGFTESVRWWSHLTTMLWLHQLTLHRLSFHKAEAISNNRPRAPKFWPD